MSLRNELVDALERMVNVCSIMRDMMTCKDNGGEVSYTDGTIKELDNALAEARRVLERCGAVKAGDDPLTRRDYLAGMALMGTLFTNGSVKDELTSNWAVALADTLIRVLDAPEGGGE